MFEQIEPKETEKCFNFKGYGVVKLKGYLWAKDINEAIELIENKKYDEIDIEIENIEDINWIEED